jgi:hypothetical protein
MPRLSSPSWREMRQSSCHVSTLSFTTVCTADAPSSCCLRGRVLPPALLPPPAAAASAAAAAASPAGGGVMPVSGGPVGSPDVDIWADSGAVGSPVVLPAPESCGCIGESSRLRRVVVCASPTSSLSSALSPPTTHLQRFQRSTAVDTTNPYASREYGVIHGTMLGYILHAAIIYQLR